MDRVTASFFMSLLLVGGGRRTRRRVTDGLVDAEPHNVREIISGQAVCLIFRVQVSGGCFCCRRFNRSMLVLSVCLICFCFCFCFCFRWHPRIVSSFHASPLCGAAPTFLCRRKEK